MIEQTLGEAERIEKEITINGIQRQIDFYNIAKNNPVIVAADPNILSL